MQRLRHAPEAVFLLADHLDTVLAACEDLLELPEQFAEPVLLASSLRGLELSTIRHLLEARERANAVGRADPRLTSETSRFLAATARLPDMAKDLGKLLSGGDFFSVTNHFQIGRCMAVGEVTHHAATLLDALESYYVLFDDQTEICASQSPLVHSDATPSQSDIGVPKAF